MRTRCVGVFLTDSNGGAHTNNWAGVQLSRPDMLGPDWFGIPASAGGITSTQGSNIWTNIVRNKFPNAKKRALIYQLDVNDVGASDATVVANLATAWTNNQFVINQAKADAPYWDYIILCTPPPFGSSAGFNSWSAAKQTAYDNHRALMMAFNPGPPVYVLDLYTILLDTTTAGQLAQAGLNGAIATTTSASGIIVATAAGSPAQITVTGPVGSRTFNKQDYMTPLDAGSSLDHLHWNLNAHTAFDNALCTIIAP